MIFKYKVYNDEMKIIDGEIKANNLEEAKKQLHEQRYRLIELFPAKKEFKIIKYKRSFSYSELSYLFAEISLMLKGGIDLIKVIDLIIEGNTGRKKQYFVEIQKELMSGKFLSQAMEKTQAFPQIVLGMIQVAELSGALDETFLKLSQYYKREAKLNKKINNALAYPILLGITCLIVSHVILKFVFPIFVDIFSTSHIALPWSTELLLSFSQHSTLYGSYYFIAFLFSMLLFLIGLFIPKIRYYIDKFLVTGPIIGPIYRKKFELLFINAMLIQTNTGVELLQIIKSSSNLTKNLYLKGKFLIVEEKLKLGQSLVDSLGEEIPLSKRTISLLFLGEDSSSFSESLLILSNLLHESYEDKIDKLGIYLEPILILFMSLLVGFIVFSIAIPMFDLVNQI